MVQTGVESLANDSAAVLQRKLTADRLLHLELDVWVRRRGGARLPEVKTPLS